ncbi:MAG: hypothetical protein HY319_12785 [Armatimonadetes bacterium]|nr:hypothetical protein [Armatimonadota bacterium]
MKTEFSFARVPSFLLCVLLLLAPLAVAAQDQTELADNVPVAIVSLVQGEAEIKHVDGEWRALFWMDLLRPEDQIRTAADGKAVVTFFFDDHMEIVDANTEGQMAFRNVKQTSPSGQVRKDPAPGRAVAEIPLPYMLLRKLYRKEFVQAEEPGALEKEKIFLAAWVKSTADPPVFYWSNVGAPSYRLQLFNEWDEFLFEGSSKENRFKYPYNAKQSLARNSLYKWQVTTPDDQIVVRKYDFILLTTLHAREIAGAEKQFEALKKSRKLMPIHYVDMFMLYAQKKMVDKYIHLLQDMIALDPENPVLYRALTRAYLLKGCPAHALEAHEREIQLGGYDPILN